MRKEVKAILVDQCREKGSRNSSQAHQ